MLKYKQFLQLTEGGNIQLGKKGGDGAQAAPFDSSKRETTHKDMLGVFSDLHDKMFKQHGVHLFGKDKSALQPGKDPNYPGSSVPSGLRAGSTKFLYDKTISHKDYAGGIKKTGDVDSFVDETHKEKLEHTLSSLPVGSKLGNSTYLGWKPGGGESHILVKHPEHEHPLQLDLNHVKYVNGHPTKGAQFSRTGGSFEDRKVGVKGKHVNMLLNATAKTMGMKKGPKGLKDADAPPSAYGEQTPEGISKKLFGVVHDDVESFSGIIRMIKKHLPAPKHKEIHDHFVASLEKDPDGPAANKPAIDMLRKHLGVRE